MQQWAHQQLLAKFEHVTNAFQSCPDQDILPLVESAKNIWKIHAAKAPFTTNAYFECKLKTIKIILKYWYEYLNKYKTEKTELYLHQSVTCSQKYPVRTQFLVLGVPGHDRSLSTANSCLKNRLVFTVWTIRFLIAELSIVRWRTQF